MIRFSFQQQICTVCLSSETHVYAVHIKRKNLAVDMSKWNSVAEDESHDWDMAVKGYRLFRWGRAGMRDRDVALYLKRWIEYEDLQLKNSPEPVEGL